MFAVKKSNAHTFQNTNLFCRGTGISFSHDFALKKHQDGLRELAARAASVPGCFGRF